VRHELSSKLGQNFIALAPLLIRKQNGFILDEKRSQPMDQQHEFIQSYMTLMNKFIGLNQMVMAKELAGYRHPEVETLEFIANHPDDANVTKLAEYALMTRGAITKITNKMIEKGLITDFKKTENKKERFFELTEKGREVNDIHTSLNQAFFDRDKPVFDQVSSEELEQMTAFAKMYTEHLDAEIAQIQQ
jgi:DNA-binding MarR family transcriptional regulator